MFKKLKDKLLKAIASVTAVISLAVPTFATADSGTMSSAISEVQTSLTGVLGYLNSVTSGILGNDLWLLGMGFFVLLFIAGFVMYLFRVGRR